MDYAHNSGMSKLTNRINLINRLTSLGFSFEEANQLRRIEMTLHRWAELECGDGNDNGSWCITRGRKEKHHGQHAGGHGAHYHFIHDDNGTPFMEYHSHSSNDVIYSAIPDRERGALKRLDAILAKHPGLVRYQQTDPRGCALYILRRTDVGDAPIDSVYTRGVAVCD